MSKDLYLFENNWLTGPYSAEALLSRFAKVPSESVPPIWEEGADQWQSILAFKSLQAVEETHMLLNVDAFYHHLPPGGLMLVAAKKYTAESETKKQLQDYFSKYRETKDPEWIKKIEAVLNQTSSSSSRKKRTNEFGNYRILSLLGIGGMGKTYKALQLSMDRIVTLKVLKSDIANDQEFIQDFKNEAKSIASLNHPNIVHAYEAGKFGGRHYLCMEYVKGESLKQKMLREGKLSILDASELVLKILEALQHACEHKLVHRDISPGNILLGVNGEVKLADYGLAQRIQSVIIDVNPSGKVKGSPYFISPEQLRASPKVDIRADIYSLGCTFFYILSGEFPFKGSNVSEVVKGHLQDELPDITKLVPEVSDGLRKILVKMTNKSPDDRYNTPHAVLIDLLEEREKYISGGPPLHLQSVETLTTLKKKLDSWKFGEELEINIDKENREYTHLVLTELEKHLEKADVVDEFFGYACTLYTELVENGFDHGCGVKGKVKIILELTSAFFRIIVEDTGAGFDYRKELDLIKGEKRDRERRRGLFQILNITKSVSYNEKGNRVKAIVYRKSDRSKIITNLNDNIQMIEIMGRGDNLLTREFENYVSEYETSGPMRVCLMIRTPWVASLFVTHLAALRKKLEAKGSPFCVFVENHSCFKIMQTLGVTEFVKVYESMNEALAYLNFSSVEEKQVKTEEKKLPGFHGKPKELLEKEKKAPENKNTKKAEGSGLFKVFKRDHKK